MPGMFDDLIPSGGGGGGGMFDDLIPKDTGVGGLPPMGRVGRALEAVTPTGGWGAGIQRGLGTIGEAAAGFKQGYEREPFNYTGNMWGDIGHVIAEAPGRMFTGAQEAVHRGLASTPIPGGEQLGRDIAGTMESEGFGGGRGMGSMFEGEGAAARGPAREAPEPAAAAMPERAAPVPEPEIPAAEPRENTNVRLLRPEVPHDLPPRGRASVGAAGTEQSPLAGYSPQTIETARDLLAQSGLDNPHQLEARLDEISPHHMFGEMSPALELETAGVNAADKGQARNLITQSVLERRREAPQRESALLDSVFGQAQNRAALRKAIEAERAKQATPLWQRFTQTPIPPTDQLRALLPRLDAAGALRAANRAMAEEGLPAEQGFALAGTNEAGQFATQIEHMPTAAAFQYAKEHVDGLIEKALASPGEAKAARRYTNLSNALRDAIDNHPDQNVAGIWQAARQAWERPSQLLSAQKLGSRLLTNNIHREDLPGLLEGWDPERLQNLLIGVRGHLEDLLRANRNPTRTSSRVMDALLSEGAQEKLRSVLQPDQVERLITGMQHEESMHGAPQRIIGGSPTSERQAARNRYTAEGQGAVGKTLGRTAEFVRHPIRSTLAKGMEKAAEHLGNKNERLMGQLRDELSRIFTTQGADRNAIARALIGAEEPGPGTWSRGVTPGGAGERSPPAAGPAARPSPVYGGTAAGWRPVTPEEAAAALRSTAAPAGPIGGGAPVGSKGKSLFQFLASKGGLKRTPDLQHTLDKRHSLFRANGMSEEDAMTAAVEAGYLDTEAGIRGRGNIRDFHDAIREEAHGNKRYPIGTRQSEAFNPDENRHRIGQAVDDYFDEIGQSPSSSMLRDRIVELVEKEGLSPEVAHERAVMEEYNEEAEGGRGGIPMASGKASPGGLHRGNEGQRGKGEATSHFGEAHTKEAQRWVGSHQKKLERDDDIPFRRGGRVRREDGGDVTLSPDAQALASVVEERADGGGVVEPHEQSSVGLATLPRGIQFRCGTCMFFKRGVCHNNHPKLEGRKVDAHTECCSKYDNPKMKVIA